MTHPTLRLLRPLRLSHAGRWIPSTRPLNLDRHRRTPRGPQRFDTLASDTTGAPSLQAVPHPDEAGVRSAAPLASAALPAAATKKKEPRRALGVALPDKPSPPEADECCMSGCATCVYDLYLEDLEHFYSAASAARAEVLRLARSRHAGEGGGGPPEGWSAEVLGSWEDAQRELSGEEAGPDAGGRGVEARDAAQRGLERARAGLDPSMRAFLEMEARIKAKQREREPPSSPAPGSSSLNSSPPT